MAEFKLGRLRFVWKGTWATATAYVKDDIVKYGGTSYVCKVGHTANANFDVDATANRWEIMSAGQEWKNNPWTPSTVYKLNDLVKYGGRVYVCVENHTSDSTLNGGFYTDETSGKWDLFVDGTDWTGTWLPSTYYKIGDLVRYNGRTYICTQPHSSQTGSYPGESIIDINIVSPGSGYTNGASLVIDPPDLVGGTQAAGTITVNGFGSITNITITNAGTGYTAVPNVTVAGGMGAVLSASITDSFVNGLESDSGKWEIFTEGFKWRGDWNGSQVPGSRVATSYAVNDVVKFGASLYLCTTAHTSNATAFDETKWVLFVGGLEFEDSWSPTEEYQIGDIVTYGGYAYTAIGRNTAQIPPASPGFWNLLTTGFNNRGVYVGTQTYKVGDLVRYGGNTYVAIQEVSSNESPYSEPSNWEKITDGFRWRDEWTDTPVEETYKIGDVVRYRASTYIVIDEHVPSEEDTTITATATSATSDTITCSDTSQLNPRQAIVFTGTSFGDITSGVTYYVKSVIDASTFSISETQGGGTKALSNGTGSLLGTFTSRPDLDDGTFFNSFAEGDANNVLTRRGDIVTRNAIQNIRLPKGQEGSFLKAGADDLEWDLVGRITRVFYVSTDGVDSADRGTTMSDPWRTIKYACDFVRTQIIPTVDQPAVINVKTGVYTEVFPISVPKFTSLVGDELRMSIVQPTAETSGLDKFYMRDSTTIRNFTFRGATGARLPNGTYDTLTEPNQYGTRRPTGGAWCSLDPGTGPNDESVWVGQRSPYIQNVTTFGDNAVGQKIDGALHNGGNKSITSNDFTQVMSDSIGAWCLNQGRAELVSVFTYYGYIGYLCEAGGVIRATNGNNSYGSYGSVSEGVDPTEISRTSSVDNRRLNAIIERVQTDGADKVLYLEYLNAGEEYTTATYGFEGSGTLNSIVATPVIQDGGVTEVRIIADGDNYTSVTNNAQAGTNLDIRLGAADIALTNAYNGQRILIIDGAGAGQYAYITSFDGGSKLCTLGMESFVPLEVTASTSGTNRLTVANTTTLSADMPFTVTGTVFGGLATATQYYVKSVVSGTQFTVYTDTGTKAEITFTTATGSVLLHKSGWDTIVEGITETITAAAKTNPVQITTSVAHAIFTGMEVRISGVTGMTQLNGNTYYASKTGASTFTLYSDPELLTPVDGTGYTTYISGGTAVGKQAVPLFLNTTTRYVIEPRVLVTTGENASATAVQTQGINTISVSDGGGGFTVPPEVIISGDGSVTGGFGATATATISGPVESIVIVDRGSGYISAPSLQFVGGGLAAGSPNHATATATITSTIKEVEVTNGGSGYTTPPSVTVTGTGGSGAIISSQISQVVGSVALTGGSNSGGSGYTSSPTVEFIGGEPLVFAQGTALLDAEVTSITVQEGGSGYDPATTTVTIVGSPGAGATAHAVIDFGSYVSGSTPGVITSIVMDTNGGGYATPPAVVITGDGVDASATANINGSVSSIQITNPGRGYQTAPTITFSGGGGTGAVGTVSLTGAVIGLTVVDGGRGWVGTPNLGFSGGGGSNATASVLSMDTVLDQVTLSSPGTGYTSNPAISVTGGKFTYNQTKCSRDIGLMVDAVTADMVFNSNYKSVTAGLSYLRSYSSVVLGSQKTQTLAAIEEVKQETLSYTTNSTATTRITNLFNVIIDIVDNGLPAVPSLVYSAPSGTSATTLSAASILQDNKAFIQAEIVAWINNEIADGPGSSGNTAWNGFSYNSADCSRDVGYIIDALTFDMLYGGNSSTVDAALSYYYNGSLVAEGPQSILAYGYLKDVVQDVIQNITVTPTTGNTQTQDTTGVPAGSSDDATTLADLMDIIIDVITSGIPAAPNPSAPFYSNGNTTLANIRATIQTNKTDIQETVIAWINEVYLTNSAILRARINGAVQTVTVTDPGGSFATTPQIVFANGNNLKSAFAGQRYFSNVSGRVAIGLEQKDATLAGINRMRLVARNVARNTAPSTTYQSAVPRVTGTAGPAGIETAIDAWVKAVYYTVDNGENYANAETLLNANREFIRAEAMEFWDANFPGTADATWSRDVGLMVDAVAKDVGFRGVNYTLLAGIKQVFLGTARTTDLAAADAGIEFVRDLALDIVQNEVVTPLTGLTVTATAGTTNYITTSDTSTLDEGENVIFIGTAFGGLVSNTIYYIKEIISLTQFTVSTTQDGAVATLFSSSGTLTLSKQFINDTLTLETGALQAVENLFNYVNEIILDDVADSSAFLAGATLLSNNKTYIEAETIAYVNTTFSDFDYDQALCARDVGFIVDAVAYDLVNGLEVNPTVSSTTTGVVSSITVNDGGEGYSEGVTITLSGGGSPTTTATARPIINSLTGAITGFTMTNKGRGYGSAPSVIITPDTGSGALIRAKVVGSVVNSMAVIRPGSGYSAGPCVRLVDANNTEDATFLVRTADGVLDQPRFTSRGIGFTTADALVDGDGYADIAQVGQFVYVDNLTNIPTPGANIQFADSDAYYKLVTIREVVGPSGIIGARQILQDNKEFVQYEILSYLNNFTYDSVKCSRDLGIIIDAIADDFTYDGNARTLAVQYQYTRGTYPDFEQTRMQTAFALEELQTEIDDVFNVPFDDTFAVSRKLDLLIEWVKNGEAIRSLPALDMPDGGFDTQDDRAKNIILANEAFIVAQVIAWMNNNSKLVGRNNTIFQGEIRQIARSIAYDLTYTGNSQTVEFASSYYIDSTLTIPGVTDSAASKAGFLDTLNYINTLLQDIVVNNNVTPESGNALAQNQSLTPGDSASQGRVNTLMTSFYAIANSGFAGSGVSLTASSFSGFTTTNRTTLLSAKSTLQSTIINWINNTFVTFTYDQDVCFRDTGYIVQALADDIFGDVAKSIEAGQRYYAATAALVLSEQRPQTIAAIYQIGFIVQKLIRNETYTRTQTNAFQVRYPSITNGDEAGEHLADLILYIRRILEVGSKFDLVKQLLLDNKRFIQAETVAYVSASYENLDYNVDLCYRDVGLIVDAICYDIYGGLSRSREAGLRYYQSASALIAITTQYEATVDALNYANDIIQAILNNQDPAIAFQEQETRISDPDVVWWVDELEIDTKVDTAFTEIINIIDNGPSSLPPGRYSARLQLSPPLTISTAPAHNTAMVIRSRYSQVRLTGHDFLNIGTGNKNDTNYPGIPLNAPDQNREIVEQGGGRVFYTSTDQDGNFRVGELFKVEQSTGIATLNADAFNLSGLNELTLGGVNLGGTGATINEFSTDGTFFANSDRIVPTQKAIKTYIQSALGSGGGNIAVNAVTAGDVFITGKEIDTVGGATLSLISADGIEITSPVQSSSTSTGALVVTGGVGILDDVNIGGDVSIQGGLTVTSTGVITIATGTTAQRPGGGTAGMLRFNTTISRFEGYNGTSWSSVGEGNPWVTKSTSYTAVNGDRIFANTATGAFTITLPSAPAIGDTIKIIDGAGTFDLNSLTIGRNGSNIMGDSADMTVNTKNAALTLVFFNTTYGWRLGEA